jgi:hypothetical protein
MRVGRNRLSNISPPNTLEIGREGTWADFLDDSRVGDLFGIALATANDFNPDETFFVGGDSGGPSFIADAFGTLELVGIHSYAGTTPDEDFDGVADQGVDGMGIEIPVRRVSGDAYLPSHIADINAAVAAITPIPEPSSLICLAAVAGLCCLWSTRRSMAFIPNSARRSPHVSPHDPIRDSPRCGIPA